MTKLLSFLFVLSLSTACIKTADQIAREKRFESMSEQITDSQSLLADMVSQMKDMQKQLDRMNGRIEELEHNQKKFDPNALKNVSDELALIKSQRETDSAQLTQIQNELKEQRTFIEKVTASLSTMGQSPRTSKNKKKSAKEQLTGALELVKRNDYDGARAELSALIDDKELSPGDVNKVLHGLGKVEFFSKNYDKALVYFSKIYSRYPKASLAPSSLLFIGKSLQKLGKKDEAKEAFAKLNEDYPQAKEAQEAKKEL